jgi:hypothetical protein
MCLIVASRCWSTRLDEMRRETKLPSSEALPEAARGRLVLPQAEHGGNWKIVDEFTEIESGKNSDRPVLDPLS